MPDILTLLLGNFALYILLYGSCWSIDKTDIEKQEPTNMTLQASLI